MSVSHDESILRSLRRISRAIDIFSRHLARVYDLTGPQLVCLRELRRGRSISPGELARRVSLSAATVTGILDRLESRRLVRRRRSSKDKRRVIVSLTPEGRALVETAPEPLHHRLAAGLAALSEEQREAIDRSLALVVEMMEATELEAAPLLTAGSTTASASEVAEFLDPRAGPGRR